LTELRRIGEVLYSALARLETSDQARAYGAWARAAGQQIASGAHPKAFNRGVLTVECASSVWANELTYLSDQLLRRMQEVAPDHPVKQLRFMVGGWRPRQEDEAPAAKKEGRDERPAPPDLHEARARAEGVCDDRLRAAIQAALQTTAEDPPGPSAGHPL
jgi:hypothetical protein